MKKVADPEPSQTKMKQQWIAFMSLKKLDFIFLILIIFKIYFCL